ncbi:hypothetical protein BAE44_0008719 [Dichanthelium oligosanthes]|uniref:AB hydrolase-1 domain-containing protein n=1 Tax=Dichanthelium oligosanthes TaxID=888268 RepID=A0A1E5VYQ2_9POAL|nr:hypothetical protein BAE44_0008719 [Dichanthelium oligosanthes]
MGFGVVSLLNGVFRRMFTSAGLRPASATVDADDTTIHFWAHPSLLQPSSEPPQQRRPVVVLIHGFGPDPTWQWAAQAGPLSRHFDLVVPTLLFFGASATRAPARSDAFQAAALAALLTDGAHLPGLGAGRTVHVVGTSYGGLVAYHLARELHQRGGGVVTTKVALCDSDACKGAEDDRALAARTGVAEVTQLLVPADTRALRRLMAVCAHRPVKYIPECLLRDMLQKYFADKREDKIALIKGITTGEGFQLTPLPQEVLIIWGEFDQIFPVEKAHKMKDQRDRQTKLALAMGFGVVSLLDAVFRRSFTSAGLRPGSAAVDADTTIHFWAHRSLLHSSTATTEHQQQKRPVVVLIHGFGPGPTWQWAAQVGPLSRHFDLVVPTLLFFGASRTSAPARSEATQAAAVAALLTGGGRHHLPGLGPGRPVHVVGASYGGVVAYHLARALLQHQRGGGAVALVGKVVLCDSDMTKGPEDDRALAARGGMQEVTELMVPADTKTMRRVTALSFHRPPKYMPECIARDLLRVRTFSPYIHIYACTKLGEKATVKVIPNSGHLPSQEEPKLFNRVLLEFLLQPSNSNGSATVATAAKY